METLEDIKKKYKDFSVEALHLELYKKIIRIAELEDLKFGTKSEKLKSTTAIQYIKNLFDEAELNKDSSQDDIEDNTHDSEEDSVGSTEGDDPNSGKKKKKRAKKKFCTEGLEKVIEVNDLPEEEKVDDNGNPLRKIGTDIQKFVEVIPKQIFVREVHTPKYAKDIETEVDFSTKIVSAPREIPLFPKSPATPSLLAYIITSKYMDALPLYRQQLMFDRCGFIINRNTMANWVIKGSGIAKPLVDLMQKDILSGPAALCDETRTQTLIEPNKTAESQSYMWCLGRTVGFSAVVFHYSPYRNKSSAYELLADYEGYLTCDGYSVYDAIAKQVKLTLTGCFAHMRRKFDSALKIAKKNGKNAADTLALEALNIIARLYAIEEKIKDEPPDKKLEIRQEQSKPIVEELKTWLDEKSKEVLPSSPTGKAISYALGQWDKLVVFLESGHVPIDNNFVERRIRPFTIGRNNWVFSVSQDGAEASAIFYSLVETAKLNGVCPYDYLRIVFKELTKEMEPKELEKLLPYNISKYFNVKKLSKSHK